MYTITEVLSVAVTSALFVLVSMYTHAFLYHRKIYLGLWLLGWIFYFADYGIRLIFLSYSDVALLQVLDQGVYICSNFLLCAGIILYTGRKLPKVFLPLLMIVLITNSVGIFLHSSIMNQKYLEITFVAMLFVYAGITYNRKIATNKPVLFRGCLYNIVGFVYCRISFCENRERFGNSPDYLQHNCSYCLNRTICILIMAGSIAN
jgi:hypothetical protein